MSTVPETFASMVAANVALTSRATKEAFVTTRVCLWTPDAVPQDGAVFIVVVGPDDCDMPERDKFFRGLKAYGDGTGHYIAFVDSVMVAQGAVSATNDGEHTNYAPFPRGTCGRKVIVILAMTGRLDYLDFHYDPMGTIEDK